MTAEATTSAAAPSNHRRPCWPLLLLALAGPAWGQPAPGSVNAVPAAVAGTGFAALDAELPDPLPSQTLALFAALDVSGRRAISALLPWLPDGRAGAFFTTLAGAPDHEQTATIQLLSRLSKEQAMGTGILLQSFGDESWPDFFALAAALPGEAPFNPSTPGEGCLAIATTANAQDRCLAAAGAFRPPEMNPQGPGMTLAEAGTAPWQAQIFRSGADAANRLSPRGRARQRLRSPRDELPDHAVLHLCGGVFLGEGLVLTAAHCIGDWARYNGEFFEQRQVRLGTRDIDSGGQIWSIKAVVRHGDYAAATSGNDIALLLLDGPPAGEERETITPARLPKRPARVGTSVRLTGWGVTGVTEFGSAGRDVEGKLQSSSRYLRVGTIRVQRPADCNSNANFRSRRYRLVAGQICAGSPDGVDACKGDSGGPLVRLAATRSGFQPARPFEVVALVSYGPGCGLARTPGVYTDVHHFADWVAGARAQFQPGRIIDWVPGRCLHDNAKITCATAPDTRGTARP